MPNKRNPHRLSDRDLVTLLKIGVYSVDIDLGVVRGQKNTILKTDVSREVVPFIRLYHGKWHRKIALGRLVWIAATLRPVPRGFQIHHRDVNPMNNSWRNLICLYHLDHDKFHKYAEIADDEGIPA